MSYKKYIAQAGLTIGGQTVQTPGGLANVTPDKAGPFGENLMQLAVSLMLIAAVVFALIFLIWGGIGWIISGGDKNGVEAARARIMYAVIGLVLTLSAFIIIKVIGYFFGVDLLQNPLLPGATT
jgi:hypothetical protein